MPDSRRLQPRQALAAQAVLCLAGAAAGSEWTEWPVPAASLASPDFLFPDQLPRLRKAMPNIPAGPVPRGCGPDHDYCEAVTDYPEAAPLRRRLERTLGRAEKDLAFPPLAAAQAGEAKTRLLGPGAGAGAGGPAVAAEGLVARAALSSESPACDSHQTFVYPRTARNRGRQWRFVINLPGELGEADYVQAVQVEQCLRPGKRCNIASAGYDTTVCRQKYSWRRLLAIDDDGQEYVDSFRFPSCCVCFTQRAFHHHHFELLRNAVEAATSLQPASTESSVTSVGLPPVTASFRWAPGTNTISGAADTGQGGQQGEEQGAGAQCNNRFCRSQRKEGRARPRTRKRKHRRPWRRMAQIA